MATLQELETRFQELKNNLEEYEEQKAKAVEGLKSAKTDRKELNRSVRELESQISAFDKVIAIQTDKKEKEKLELQKREIEKELEAKKEEIDRLTSIISAKTEAEENITRANEAIQSIILEFASDPRINTHLQELISIKYDEQIEQKENERDYKTQLAERLSSDLQDDKIFGTLVLDLVKKYSEVKKLPEFIIDEESKKKSSSARGALTKSINKLQAAITSRPEYEDLVLTQDDFIAIVSGPNEEGNYEIPSMQESIVTIDKTITDLDDKKTKVIEKIQKALVSERVDEKEATRIDALIKEQEDIISQSDVEIQNSETIIKEIDKDIEDLKTTFTVIDTTGEEKALQDSKDVLSECEFKRDQFEKDSAKEVEVLNEDIDRIDTEIGALDFDKEGLDKLRAFLPKALLDNKEKAQKEYDEAVKALKDKGYIDEDIYPELISSDCQLAFKAFRDADLRVREAFLNCETNNSEEAKKELKAAMEGYTTASEAILAVKGMEGLTVENWHDYLIRKLNEEAENGEINEVYYEGVLEGRLDRVQEENELNEGEFDKEFSAVKEVAKVLSDQQEAFLKGGKVEFAKVEENLEKYHSTINSLFDKVKGTVNSIENLYGMLREKIQKVRKIGFFSRIGAKLKNIFNRKNNSREIVGTKTAEEKDMIEGLKDEVKEKEESLLESKDGINNYFYTKHERGEYAVQEYELLEEQETKVEKLKQEQKAKTDRKTAIGEQVAKLYADVKEAETIVSKRQKDLDEAKAKTTITPEQKAKFDELQGKKELAEKTKANSETAKSDAKKTISDLQTERAALKPTMPKEVVKNARNVVRGEGQKLTKATLEEMEI